MFAGMIASALMAAAAPAVWGAVDGTAPPECKEGPVTRSFGGRDWNVYGCRGHEALAAIPSATDTENAGTFVLVIREAGRFRTEQGPRGEPAAKRAVVEGLTGPGFDRALAETRAGPGSPK